MAASAHTLYLARTPFLPWHTPDCPTFINAYSPILPMQRAVVEALARRIRFARTDPVDVTGGSAGG